jgi:hypothetical protein
MNAICKCRQRCPSYQRRPNKPVNAMLAFEYGQNFSSFNCLNNNTKYTLPLIRTALTG